MDNRDVSQIHDEEILRQMWQETEDFSRKKEIRQHISKIRENRLKEFYNSSESNIQSTTSSHQNSVKHADALMDQSFAMMKRKEVRDGQSPNRELSSYQLNKADKNWVVEEKNELSKDGKTASTYRTATTSGTEKIPGGVCDYEGKAQQEASVYKDGDDKNYVKSTSAGNHAVVKQSARGGDANSSFESSCVTSKSSSKKVTEHKSETPENRRVFTEEKVMPDGSIMTVTRYETSKSGSSKQEVKSSHSSEQRSSSSTTSQSSSNRITDSSRKMIESNAEHKDVVQQTNQNIQHVRSNKDVEEIHKAHIQKVMDVYNQQKHEEVSHHDVQERNELRNRQYEIDIQHRHDQVTNQQQRHDEVINRQQRRDEISDVQQKQDEVINRQHFVNIERRHDETKNQHRDVKVHQEKNVVKAVKTNELEKNVCYEQDIKNRQTMIDTKVHKVEEIIPKEVRHYVTEKTHDLPQRESPRANEPEKIEPSKPQKQPAEEYKQPPRVKSMKPEEPAREKTTGLYETTYRSHYTPQKISVEVSPTHDAFARSLRSLTPEDQRAGNRRKHFNERNSSTMSRFASNETVTLSQPRKFEPPRGRLEKSKSKSPKKSIVDTNRVKDDRRTLRRSDTYEERVRQILGITGTDRRRSSGTTTTYTDSKIIRKSPSPVKRFENEKSPSPKARQSSPALSEFPSQNRPGVTREYKSPSPPSKSPKYKNESPKSNEYPSQIRRPVEKQKSPSPPRRYKEIDEPSKLSEFPAQKRYSVEKEKSPSPTRRIKEKDEPSKLSEFPSQKRYTVEKERSVSPEKKPKERDTPCQLSEFPSQVRKSPTKDTPDYLSKRTVDVDQFEVEERIFKQSKPKRLSPEKENFINKKSTSENITSVTNKFINNEQIINEQQKARDDFDVICESVVTEESRKQLKKNVDDKITEESMTVKYNANQQIDEELENRVTVDGRNARSSTSPEKKPKKNKRKGSKQSSPDIETATKLEIDENLTQTNVNQIFKDNTTSETIKVTDIDDYYVDRVTVDGRPATPTRNSKSPEKSSESVETGKVFKSKKRIDKLFGEKTEEKDRKNVKRVTVDGRPATPVGKKEPKSKSSVRTIDDEDLRLHSTSLVKEVEKNTDITRQKVTKFDDLAENEEIVIKQVDNTYRENKNLNEIEKQIKPLNVEQLDAKRVTTKRTGVEDDLLSKTVKYLDGKRIPVDEPEFVKKFIRELGSDDDEEEEEQITKEKTVVQKNVKQSKNMEIKKKTDVNKSKTVTEDSKKVTKVNVALKPIKKVPSKGTIETQPKRCLSKPAIEKPATIVKKPSKTKIDVNEAFIKTESKTTTSTSTRRTPLKTLVNQQSKTKIDDSKATEKVTSFRRVPTREDVKKPEPKTATPKRPPTINKVEENKHKTVKKDLSKDYAKDTTSKFLVNETINLEIKRTDSSERLTPVRTEVKKRPLPPKLEKKCVSTKSIVVNPIADQHEIIVDLKRSKSSREETPDDVWPISVEDDSGIPRYPDHVVEPEDFQKPKRKIIPLEENEVIEEFERCIEVDDDSLLTVEEKIKKFAKSEESVIEKTSVAPKIIREDIEIDETLKEDECLLSVSDKVNKFTERKTTEEINKVAEKKPRLEFEVSEDLKNDECLLSVSDKVQKFITTAKQVSQTVSLEDIEKCLATKEEEEQEIIRKSKTERKSPEKERKNYEVKPRKSPEKDRRDSEPKPKSFLDKERRDSEPKPRKSPEKDLYNIKPVTVDGRPAKPSYSQKRDSPERSTKKETVTEFTRFTAKTPSPTPIIETPKSSKTYDSKVKINNERISKARALFENGQTNDASKRTSTSTFVKRINDSQEVKLQDIGVEPKHKTLTVTDGNIPHYMLDLDRTVRDKSPNKPSVMEIEEITKSTRRSSNEESKFGVTLKRTDSETHKEPRRKSITVEIDGMKTELEIEEIFDLEILEQLLETVIGYDLRRRIRAQIRIVKQKLSEQTETIVFKRKSPERVTKTTRITEQVIRRVSPERKENYSSKISSDNNYSSRTCYKASTDYSSPVQSPTRISPSRTAYDSRKSSLDSNRTSPARHVSSDSRRVSTESSKNEYYTQRETVLQKPREPSPVKRTPLDLGKVTRGVSPSKKSPSSPRTEVSFKPFRRSPEPRKPTSDKPEWITNRNLKKASERKFVTKSFTSSANTSSSSAIKRRTEKDADLVTSSYGIGPTDESGTPLFGLKALKSVGQKVSGTVTKSSYYQKNNEEPIGEVSYTKYSTDANDFKDEDVETRNGLLSKTTTQRFGGKDAPAYSSLVNQQVGRRGSVKEILHKFIENAVESSKSERQHSTYPKAGLILRTSSFKSSGSGSSREVSPEMSSKRVSSTTSTYSTSRRSSSKDENVLRKQFNTKEFQEGVTRTTRTQVTKVSSQQIMKKNVSPFVKFRQLESTTAPRTLN